MRWFSYAPTFLPYGTPPIVGGEKRYDEGRTSEQVARETYHRFAPPMGYDPTPLRGSKALSGHCPRHPTPSDSAKPPGAGAVR